MPATETPVLPRIEPTPPPPLPSPAAARTRLLLEGPIVSTLLRLGAPNAIVNIVLIAVTATVDAYFVGQLGPSALAGLALVFPSLMLMQQVANGSMGGAMASAVARAIGSGRKADATALAAHALFIALGMAALFTTTALTAGPALYGWMGGEGAALDAALEYSTIIFAGALVYWVLGALTSLVRGAGQAGVLGVVYVAAELVHIALVPTLVFGLGPIPALGITGAGIATVASFAISTVVLAWYLVSGRTVLTLSFRNLRLERRLFAEILRVGVPMSLNPVLGNVTLGFVTAYVGLLGPTALAGFGAAVRLEYVQIPLTFGLGATLLAMVGTNIGAGQLARATRIVWTAAALTVGATGSIGVVAAVWPALWVGLFTVDPEIHVAAAGYLRIVGLVYPCFGLGLTLSYAFQAAGRTAWVVGAIVTRVVIVGVGGAIVVRWTDAGLVGLALVCAAALVIFGSIPALAFRAGAWLPGRPAVLRSIRVKALVLPIVATLLATGCAPAQEAEYPVISGRRVQGASAMATGRVPFRVGAYELVFADTPGGADSPMRAGLMVDLVGGHGPAQGFVEWTRAGELVTPLELSLSYLDGWNNPGTRLPPSPRAIRVVVREASGEATRTRRR